MLLRRLAFILAPLIVLVVAAHLLLDFLPSIRNKKNEVKETKLNIQKDKPVKIPRPSPKQTNNLTYSVVIDPGHGGDNLGCKIHNNLLEKDLNLKFSFILARMLRMNGINAYLERSGDFNIPDEEKYAFAIEQNADLLISIHTACSNNKAMNGVDVFAFDTINKDTELENQENKFTQDSGKEYQEKVTAYLEKEERIASYILSSFSKKTNFTRRRFIAISEYKDIPSLIFFIGYLTNKEDLSNLSRDSYLEKTAEKLSTAIINGLTQKLPEKIKKKTFLGNPFKE